MINTIENFYKKLCDRKIEQDDIQNELKVKYKTLKYK